MLKAIDRKKLLKVLTVLILLIFIFNYIGNKFHWYYSVWYFDMIMHFFGGFWTGLVYFFIFPFKEQFQKSFLPTIVFVFFIGIVWEIVEPFINPTMSLNLFSLDTVSDIFFDLSGGTLAILYLLKRIMVSTENEV